MAPERGRKTRLGLVRPVRLWSTVLPRQEPRPARNEGFFGHDGTKDRLSQAGHAARGLRVPFRQEDAGRGRLFLGRMEVKYFGDSDGRRRGAGRCHKQQIIGTLSRVVISSPLHRCRKESQQSQRSCLVMHACCCKVAIVSCSSYCTKLSKTLFYGKVYKEINDTVLFLVFFWRYNSKRKPQTNMMPSTITVNEFVTGHSECAKL
mmetsp:Transcript_28081/g.58347  ORF Transcript_28081/g.58347 Transcript_28081/m.58347 type:complete len:205 (+) Transcript_28081:841-1455(+)